MITDCDSAIKYVMAHRGVREVRVEPAVLDFIRHEIRMKRCVLDAPRPTYRGPYGNIDRLLWDNLQAQMAVAPVFVCGVRLVADEFPQKEPMK